MKTLMGVFFFFFLSQSYGQLVIDGRNKDGADPGAKVIDTKKKTIPVKELKVLFVGDNYSEYNSLPQVVQYIGAQLKKPVQIQIGKLTAANLKFSHHLTNPATAETLKKYKWDFVVFQDHANQPLDDPDATKRDGASLIKMAIENGARPVIFMTWANKLELDRTKDIFTVYKDLCLEHKVLMAPVGTAWLRANKAYPKLQFYQENSNAPAAHGSYLAAAVITAAITRQAVLNQKHTGLKSVSSVEGKALQKIATKTVIDYGNYIKKALADSNKTKSETPKEKAPAK